MKKVKVTADLEIKNASGTIAVRSDDKNIFIDVSSPSAVTFPLKTYLKFKQYTTLSRYLSQKINVLISGKDVLSIKDGQIYYLQKWWLFKFLLKSIFK